MTPIERIEHGLIVSCQAWPESPLHGPLFMAAMAQAAAIGGAAGIRANGPDDIAGIRKTVALPIIGIQKSYDSMGRLWITAGLPEARAVAIAGADIIAIDARREKRPDGTRLADLIARVKTELNVPVMADVATYDQGLRAQERGADLVATTFAIEGRTEPDFELIRRLVVALPVPVVAEGLYWTPDQVCRALELGAHAVVVGSAITRPDDITRRFVAAVKACVENRPGHGDG